jgi:hypothetical protein
MSIQVVNAPLVYGSGLSNRTFDLNGVTLQRGPNLGDRSLIQCTGTDNVARDFFIDEMNLSGVTGAALLTGTRCSFEDATLDRCQRYGFIVSRGVSCAMRRLTILKAQHTISGSSGSVGDWSPSVDTTIEDCDIKGMIIDGIKLKNMLRTTVRRNRIDVFPFYPGYEGQSTYYSKSGVYFAGSDTANKDCTMEDNEIFQSAPTPSGLASNRAVLVNADQTAVPSVFSSGNKVVNNTFHDVYTGAWIRGNNYYFEGNAMTNVPVPYKDDGVGNTIIVGVPKYLTLQSSLPQLPWTVNGAGRVNGVYPFAQGATVTLQVPKTIKV